MFCIKYFGEERIKANTGYELICNCNMQFNIIYRYSFRNISVNCNGYWIKINIYLYIKSTDDNLHVSLPVKCNVCSNVEWRAHTETCWIFIYVIRVLYPKYTSFTIVCTYKYNIQLLTTGGFNSPHSNIPSPIYALNSSYSRCENCDLRH